MEDLTAAGRWRRDLEAWALPDDLLARADEDPWGWPEAVLARMRRDREAAAESPTLAVAERSAGLGGSILDVGAGAGRVSIPLARRGHPVTAVEPDPVMLTEIRGAAAGLPVEVVEGRWPDAAPLVVRHDVAVCAHVVYDVADLAPFLVALHRAAATLVLECGADHPWAGMAPLFGALHGLDRPAGPTAADLAEVVEEVTGAVPQVTHWEAERPLRFSDEAELLAFYRRRLVLDEVRTPELRALLAADVAVKDGWWIVERGPRRLVTMWWKGA